MAEYKWQQNSGILTLGDKRVTVGYSGAPGHLNRTESESLSNRGPIPRGWYTISLVYPRHPKIGSNCAVLTPDKANNMFGRSAFMIHGDSIATPGRASEGCIVVDSKTRSMLRLNDRIQVV